MDRIITDTITIMLKQRGITQGKAAERMGISRIALNRFLNGRSQLRTNDFINLLLILGIDMERELMKNFIIVRDI